MTNDLINPVLNIIGHLPYLALLILGQGIEVLLVR
jgi:hypothetical protein